MLYTVILIVYTTYYRESHQLQRIFLLLLVRNSILLPDPISSSSLYICRYAVGSGHHSSLILKRPIDCRGIIATRPYLNITTFRHDAGLEYNLM